jgi:sec-independent protein translocase protein TatA
MPALEVCARFTFVLKTSCKPRGIALFSAFLILLRFNFEDFVVFGIGPWELAIILVIVFIIFGKGKLPELGSALGEGIKNFKKSYRDAKIIDVTPEERAEISKSEETKQPVKEQNSSK